MRLDEMKKHEKDLIEKKNLKDIQKIKDTFITQIDPTKYPDLKPLSRKAIQKDEINIEYQNIIEDQARILENQYEKEIIHGLKQKMKDTSNVKSMVERIRRRKEDEGVDEEEEEKENNKEKKMQLFKSFIAYKNDDLEQKIKDKHKDKEDKWKTIEFCDRKERKKHFNEQFYNNDNEEYKQHKHHSHHKHHKKNMLKIDKEGLRSEKEFNFDEGERKKEKKKNKYKDWNYQGLDFNQEEQKYENDNTQYDNIEYVDNFEYNNFELAQRLDED
jgi:hypothetical protein